MRVTEHRFLEGDVYLKGFCLDDNERVEQHRHNFDHVTLLTQGCVLLDKGEARTVHYAPDYIFIEKGIAHAFTAINGPAKGYCTHILTGLDGEDIDKELILETDT